eukprot:g16873.t1
MMVGDPDGFIEISVSFSDISGVQGETVTAATVGSPLSFQNPDPLQLLQDQSDEFPGTSLDLSKWGYENGDGTEFGIPGWGNNELQIYAPEQATVAGGNLIITADEPTSGNFVSARLRSETVVDMSREAGRVEVRAKMPSGQGLWPAIWMLPTQDVVDEFGFWPLTGEVDIVEAVNLGVGGKQTLQSTIHYGFPFPNNSFDFVLYEPGLNPQDDFHTYAMEWETDNEAGGVANAFIGSEDLTDNPLLETGFDFGGADFAGQLLFDMRVDQLADGTQLVVKMDSGFPDLGQVTLTDITVGAWDSYSVSLADLVNSPLPDGTGLDLRDVLNLFIIEATGADPAAILADVYIDNIRIQSACPANSSCGLDAKTAATGELIVFDDALNPVWEDGLRAFDQAIGFDSCIDDNGAACPSVNWSIPVADDASRGNVVQVDYAADAQFAGLILGLNSGGVDLTEFASGEIVFDLNVTANPTSAAFIVKADCVDCPVDGGQREQNLGVPAAGWNEFRVPVADLINANGGPSVGGLKIESVTTGLVIFPAFGSTAGVSYQIDNVRWLAGDGDGDGGSGSTTGTGAVYADALDGQWVDGLSAFDQAIGFSSCANDDGAGCPSVSWAEVAAADAARGTVLDIAYAADAQFAGVVVGLNNAGLDMSSFADGNLVFDLNMVNNPNGVTMVMKVDCVGCPTDGGQREQSLGVPADGWQTITIPVADLINANGGPATGGLVIESVTTGLVIFPAFASDATNLQFQLDDVRWEAAGGSGGGSGGGGSGSSGVDGNSGTAANPVINFDDPVGTYNLSDFGNTSSGLAMDPADSSNTVVMTTKPATAEVWAGTTVNGGLLVYPLTATDNIMTVRVYSPAVGLTVRLKAEQAGTPENFVETDALTTVADAWETLTFDFGNPANGAINDTHTYDTLSIFFNFGATGTEYVFYWDDVTFVGGTSGTTTVVGTGAVYEDALDAQWTSGISAFDQAIGFASCTDDGGAGCPSVSWAEVAATDVARGTVLEVTYAGDAQFAGMIIGLNDDGLDMTEFAAGNIVFDIDVTANPSSADFVMKVDCVGCPVDAGQREQNLGLPAAGWNTYSIPVADLINASGGPGVGGLVIESVTTGLVIFPAFGSTAGVTYQIDDIRWEAGAASPVGAGAVYEDALDAQWADGLSAFDQAIGFGSCVDDNGAACPSMGWSEVAATDVARGTVLEVTYAGDAQFAGMIVGGAASGIDLSAFSSGNLVFDLNVTANPSSAAFIMKVDCVGCPVDGGQREQNLGVPAAGWNTISVPVADLINANGGPGSGGLVIESVTTGLVLFPAFGSTAGVSYQLDDVRWETGT